MKSYITILSAVLLTSCFGLPCFAGCPSADLTGDCFVDFNDFAVFADQWLTGGQPYPILNGMTWVSIYDPEEYIEGMGILDDIPIDDAGFKGEMSMDEVTNTQYYLYLSDAQIYGKIIVHTDPADSHRKVYAVSDTGFSQPYYDINGLGDTIDNAIYGGRSKIYYSLGGLFGVESGFDSHPVTYVSWYGAKAFCDYYGYKLPTKQQWQAVADYDGSYIYGCGATISTDKANYFVWGSTYLDGTTPVGSFAKNGYGLHDMAGNVFEWTNSSSGPGKFFCGGSWNYIAPSCLISSSSQNLPSAMFSNLGFRPCKY